MKMNNQIHTQKIWNNLMVFIYFLSLFHNRKWNHLIRKKFIFISTNTYWLLMILHNIYFLQELWKKKNIRLYSNIRFLLKCNIYFVIITFRWLKKKKKYNFIKITYISLLSIVKCLLYICDNVYLKKYFKCQHTLYW